MSEAGHSDEQIEEYEAKQKVRWLRYREQSRLGMTEEQFATYYQDRWGIDHDCHCATDMLREDYNTLTECEYEVYLKVRDRLEDVLVQMQALENTADMLRMQVVELGGSPRV